MVGTVWPTQAQTSDPYSPARGRAECRIWTASVMIGIQQTPAQNGGYLRMEPGPMGPGFVAERDRI